MKTNVCNTRQARARCHVSYIMNNETYLFSQNMMWAGTLSCECTSVSTSSRAFRRYTYVLYHFHVCKCPGYQDRVIFPIVGSLAIRALDKTNARESGDAARARLPISSSGMQC